MIKVKDLNVKYDNKVAVNGVSFNVKRGEIVGLIGANGSGKSSIIKALMNINTNYDGEIMVFDKDIKNNVLYRNQVGYIPENVVLFGGLKGMEYLYHVGALRGINKNQVDFIVEPFIRYFMINDLINYKISTYSKGTKQKIAIISSLIHKPKLLILDEPLDGLDSESSLLFREILKEFVSHGGAVLFSSHILEIVGTLSNKILVMEEGNLINTIDNKSFDKKITDIISYFDKTFEHFDYNEAAKSMLGIKESD